MQTPKPIKPTETFEQLLLRFGQLFCDLSTNLLQTGEVVVKMVDINPNAYEDIIKKYPTCRSSWLEMFEQIGRKQLLPELMLDTSHAARRLIHLNLSYKAQEQLYGKTIEVPRRKDDGAVVFVPKPFDKLSPSEVAIVIGPKGQRTNDEKKAMLAERERAQKIRELRYEFLDGNKVRFFMESEFEIMELIATLQRHVEQNKESEIKALQSSMQQNQVRKKAA